MAKWNVSFLIAGFVAPLALVGCKPSTPAVATLPPPSFDAPRMTAVARAAAPPAVAPRTMTSALPAPLKTYTPPKLAGNSGIPRDWVPNVGARAWQWIVIHHSATTTGGAVAFDKMHRAKGWDELGYDFVIGNGTDTADGQIEVGPRWTKQKYGAHAKTPDNRFNEYGVGICLVGNFDVERPTPRQLQSVARLASYLMRTYRISSDRVLGHGDTKPTDCPGKYMNVAQVRRQAGQLAGTDAGQDTTQAAAPTELLSDAPQ